eukprot:scaffold2425_cov76-Skeletonema_dohrnii-CCMP3373.AAC.8
MASMRFNAEQCAQLKFPVGCPVWYNLGDVGVKEASASTSSFFLKRGVIKGALLRGGKLFYEVTHVEESSGIITEEVEDGELGFGATCPVTILPQNVDADADPLEGEIVLFTPSTNDPNTFVYTAMIFLDGASTFRYEGGIDEKRVVYRKGKGKVDKSIVDKSSSAAFGAKNDNADATSSQQNSKGEVSEEMPMEAASASAFVPSSITCNAGANAPGGGGTNVSLSATDSFDSTNTNSNASADDSLSLSRKKKPRYLSEYEIGTSRNAHANRMEIAVPLWLQKDLQSQRDLFFHLIGTNGCNTKRIEYNSRCRVYIKVILGEKVISSVPMTIHVEAMNPPTALGDLTVARQLIQSLLLQFVGNDGCRGRLLYDVAQSCWGVHRPSQSTSNAVKDINPFYPTQDRGSGKEYFMSVVELPYKVTKEGKSVHAAYLLSRETLQKIQAAGAYIRVVATEFQIPTSLCEPYVLACGKTYEGVDRAVDIVKDAIRSH